MAKIPAPCNKQAPYDIGLAKLRPEEQLRLAMREAGLVPPDDVYFDGEIHRFHSDERHDNTGWYVVFADGLHAGAFGCWRSGIEETWREYRGGRYTPQEEMAYRGAIEEARQKRAVQREKEHGIISGTVTSIWEGAGYASCEHPYIQRKRIKAHGARITGDGRLMVPLFDESGCLMSLQYIDHSGGKLYHKGGRTGACFWWLGGDDGKGTVYLAEGFATAATIHEETGRPCYIAYSASNLVSIAEILRRKYGIERDIVIVADNDASGTGQNYADQAAAKYAVRVVMPPIEGMDANDYRLAGNDMLALLDPPKNEWLVSADEFCEQPAPIEWVIKHWVQKESLCMIHGMSGGGKTFVCLDMLLHVAAGFTEWQGNKIMPGNVVLLVGEGHHGIRGRIAAWKAKYGVKKLNLWLSKSGCDLNTKEGLRQVIESIRALKLDSVAVIGVDTLHRFYAGDENSAQDAKTMLDSCSILIREFSAAVVLVHHTGVSEEAQHRARGSSAWRGALDIEISIVPFSKGTPGKVVQRKNKDAELAGQLGFVLTSTDIPGWFDEDGEQITSATVDYTEVIEVTREEKKLSEFLQIVDNAWWHSGSPIDKEYDLPLITRKDLESYLITRAGKSESYAKRVMKKGSAGMLICELVKAEKLTEKGPDWVVTDPAFSSSLLMRLNDENG